LRILLSEDARQVVQQTCKTYEELSKALIDRYGRRPHQYFEMLMNIQKSPNETYRSLMSRVDQYVGRFIDKSDDPIARFKEELFMKSLPTDQKQWIRRNKGTGSVVEAAEDYISPVKP